MNNAVPDVNTLLNTGLRRLWYPILPSWQVKDNPVGITRLGEDMAVWRDGEGQVHAVSDRCPHRGARLSLGWNLGEKLACWYHGVQVNAEGVTEKVPAVRACPLEGKKTNKSYPIIETRGAIFAYFGDEVQPDPPPLVLPEQLSSDDYSSFLCAAHWKCNYRYAVDNVMDPMHGSYLHADSHSMARGDKEAEMAARKTEHGFIFEKTTQRGVNFDWVEFGDTGAHWLRLEIPYGPGAGPGPSFGIVGFATPMDENNTLVFFWRNRKVQGWQRDVWRFMYRNRLEGLHWAVLEQDRIILENMAPNAREHEFLYQHDTGMARLRRLMKQTAEKQVAERQALATQTASAGATS
ncbi:MAG: aromatic ring-hydroxylating dioxygenase subunit alpha [Thiothrix sp.]|nr:MAG: aromatic ring-hydroxylating dioxygenase subunit alpha [Thiothrix sp.]